MMQINHPCWGPVSTAMIRLMKPQTPDRNTFDKILQEKCRSVSAPEKASKNKRGK